MPDQILITLPQGFSPVARLLLVEAIEQRTTLLWLASHQRHGDAAAMQRFGEASPRLLAECRAAGFAIEEITQGETPR